MRSLLRFFGFVKHQQRDPVQFAANVAGSEPQPREIAAESFLDVLRNLADDFADEIGRDRFRDLLQHCLSDEHSPQRGHSELG